MVDGRWQMADGRWQMVDGRWYGEKIVCTAQTLGLNTCWVAMTYCKI